MGLLVNAMFLIAATPLMLASIEGLLFFVLIIGISALSNWLKQKQQRGQEGEEPSEPGGEGVPRRKGFDWEGELRRLIEGNQPSPRGPQPPPLVQPVLDEPAESLAPPFVEPVPVQRRQAPSRPAPARKPAVLVGAAFREELASRREALHSRVGKLKVSWARRAGEVEASVARRTAGLKTAGSSGMVPTTGGGDRRHASPAVRNVLTALRRPSSASEAIIAAEILGQPKGLQA